MNTQLLPGFDPGILPALAFCRRVLGDMCRNFAASFNESVFTLKHNPSPQTCRARRHWIQSMSSCLIEFRRYLVGDKTALAFEAVGVTAAIWAGVRQVAITTCAGVTAVPLSAIHKSLRSASRGALSDFTISLNQPRSVYNKRKYLRELACCATNQVCDALGWDMFRRCGTSAFTKQLVAFLGLSQAEPVTTNDTTLIR